MPSHRSKSPKAKTDCRRGRRVSRRGPYHDPIAEALLQLRHVRSAVIVAVAALRRQNCELDEDIAILLQRCVCDRLGEQLEKLESASRPPLERIRRS